jgi:glycosyltransferase involved in cell wall biosynthesis
MNPLVTVVVSAYNLGWCIEDTIRSVLAQTYRNIEIIVVDDASTDDTSARVTPFLDRITFIRHDTNQGIANNAEGGPARNTGIRHAKGEYIAFLDGDDLWEPEKISVQVETAQRFPHAGLIAVDGVPFSHEDGRILGSSLFHDYGDSLCSAMTEGEVLEADIYRRTLQGCMIDTPSQVMIPAGVINVVGPFALCRSDDYDFLVRVTAKFKVVLVKKPLVRYRCHTSSISGPMHMQFFRFAQSGLAVRKRHLKECRKEDKRFLRQQIKNKLRVTSERAREEGDQGRKLWASQFLCGLLIRNPASPGVTYVWLSFARLWCPQSVATMLRPLTVRILRYLQ